MERRLTTLSEKGRVFIVRRIPRDPAYRVRIDAVGAITPGGDCPASHLVPFLRHADAAVRSAAANALIGLAPKVAVEHVLPLLNDEQPSVRAAVVQDLARTKDPRVIAAVCNKGFGGDGRAAL